MSQIPEKRTLVVIAGPTAVGKTAVAIELALRLDTEIISADSRQFFRELNIGTAKPLEEELRRVPHHFINSHSIQEEYDAAQFGNDALKRVGDILSERSYAILCGGSGLYIRAVIEGFDDIPEVDPAIRASLSQKFNEHGILWLQEKMLKEDPEYYRQIDQQNPHRLIRALEVKIGTGSSISTYMKRSKRSHGFTIVKVGLELPREELYQRIDYRMDAMIRDGLFEEAQSLYRYKDHNALQTVGYQEIFDYMDGLYDKDEAIRLLKRNSRRYAKRQLTWFKRDPEMKWFHPREIDNIADWINTSVNQNPSGL
jgi:tRNA dimethylallyltransferase